MNRTLTILLAAACLLTACAHPEPLRLPLIGTNDVHGALLPRDDQGGLATLSGYVNSVRTARAIDGGAVLLIDAGDMWQGTLESNISEGVSVVAAFNALGYTAAAIGNHEFDFGPAGPAPIPESARDDPRGALKQRATEAEFPFLAANLIDDETGQPVAWDNVRPSVIVDVGNVKVGIIGVMSRNALAAEVKNRKVGITLETPLELSGDPESALGNLYTDAMLDDVDADISIHIISGGIRANLPAGELTFGIVYEMSPFDNQLMVIELSGAQLRQVISEQAHRGSRRAGFSGMHVDVECDQAAMTIEMRYSDGRVISDTEIVRVAVTNYLAFGGDRVFQSVMPEGGFEAQPSAPMVRNVILRSLAKRGGSISAADFDSSASRRWQLPQSLSRECRLQPNQ